MTTWQEMDERLHRWRQGTAIGVAVVCFIMIWLALTTPDLDALPEYDCVPGQVHTTKECQ